MLLLPILLAFAIHASESRHLLVETLPKQITVPFSDQLRFGSGDLPLTHPRPKLTTGLEPEQVVGQLLCRQQDPHFSVKLAEMLMCTAYRFTSRTGARMQSCFRGSRAKRRSGNTDLLRRLPRIQSHP